jgi:hypothetical protein
LVMNQGRIEKIADADALYANPKRIYKDADWRYTQGNWRLVWLFKIALIVSRYKKKECYICAVNVALKNKIKNIPFF